MDELLSIEKSTREAHERETVKNTAENAREDESDARSHTNFENDPESIQRRSALVESLYVIYSSHALPKEWVEDVEITKQVIPCQRVWDENGRELAAVVVVRRNTEALV
jgi:diphthine-ammonia ligase